MTLRTRVLLGYGFLVGLVVLSAFGAALGFHHLGSSIGRVLDENVASMQAVTQMLEALERQDSAVLAALLGEGGGAAAIEASERSFTAALERARSNVTLPEEPALLAEIDQRFADYLSSRDALLASSPERPLAAYEGETYPSFEAVKARVLDLLEVNNRAAVVADRAAREDATRRAVLNGVLVALALLSLAFVSRALSRDLLEPLAELKTVAQAIADGDRRRRSSSASRRDELGVVARQLNSVLDALETSESRADGRLAQQRQVLVALLAARDEPAALVAPDGRVVASTLDQMADRALEALAVDLRKRNGEPEVRSEAYLPGGHASLRLRPLVTPDGRPVGWLATTDRG